MVVPAGHGHCGMGSMRGYGICLQPWAVCWLFMVQYRKLLCSFCLA